MCKCMGVYSVKSAHMYTEWLCGQLHTFTHCSVQPQKKHTHTGDSDWSGPAPLCQKSVPLLCAHHIIYLEGVSLETSHQSQLQFQTKHLAPVTLLQHNNVMICRLCDSFLSFTSGLGLTLYTTAFLCILTRLTLPRPLLFIVSVWIDKYNYSCQISGWFQPCMQLVRVLSHGVMSVWWLSYAYLNLNILSCHKEILFIQMNKTKTQCYCMGSHCLCRLNYNL